VKSGDKICGVPRLLALLALVAGCQRGPSAQQPPNSGPGQGPSERPAVIVDADGPTTAAANDEPALGEDGEGPPPTLPDGPPCQADADCGAGWVCEGVGCEPGEGRCVARDRICTRDLASYCGCDGRTFQASGTCAGARYAYRGPCDPGLELGQPCTDGRQCLSGLCAGEGLEGCRPGDQGVCDDFGCTRDYVPYCGCNNFEFYTSGTCPNRQFAYRGPCEGS
jgi:hypothetical protein